MTRLYGWIVSLMCLGTLHAATQRIALLPSFADFDQRTALRSALAAYDARLQAELVEGWDSEVLARTGLSAVVFEQKLQTANDATSRVNILPADALVLSVLDFQKHELRIHLNPVKPGMRPAVARVFNVKDANHLANVVPAEVARYLSASLKLPPAAPAESSSATGAEHLTCALLEPVSTGGTNRDVAKVSPLIRAVLEQAIGSGELGVELVERSETARLLEEKTLAETWNPNAASRLGRMAKADLILSPVIHFQDTGRIHTNLFALDVASGRVLACRSWSGAPLDTPPADKIRELLAEGVAAGRESKEAPIPDNPGLRHAEAKFLHSLSDSWLGLRQLVGTKAELAILLADAGLGLSHDNPELMGKIVARYTIKSVPCPPHPKSIEYSPNSSDFAEIRELQESGQLALIRQTASSVLELPMIELAKDDNDRNKRCLGSLYIGLGEPQKALAALTAGRPLNELAQNNLLYDRIAQALMNLGRYRDCVDFIRHRRRWNGYCTQLMADAYRATGDKEQEFNLLHANVATAGSTEDRLARYLELGREMGNARATVARTLRYANAWMLNQPSIWEPFIRARLAAGQKDEAISDAQCARLAARTLRDNTRFDRLNAFLKNSHSTPIDQLPTPADCLALPDACRISLIHDQTIPADHARKVAEHLAAFWGCPVEIRAIHLDAARTPFYDKVSQSLIGEALAPTVLRAASPGASSLGTVFLTRNKLVSKRNRYVGDIYQTSAADVSVVSDHYFSKFKDYDNRDLSYVTAIAAASLPGPRWKLKVDLWDKNDMSGMFSPLPPDVFAYNGVLHVAALELGIAPRTATVLKQYGSPPLLQAIAGRRQSELANELENPRGDETTARDLAEQISKASPILISTKPTK